MRTGSIYWIFFLVVIFLLHLYMHYMTRATAIAYTRPCIYKFIVATILYMFYPSKFFSISFYRPLSSLSFSSYIFVAIAHFLIFTYTYTYTYICIHFFQDFSHQNRQSHKKKSWFCMHYKIWRNQKDKRIFEFCNSMVYIIGSPKFSIYSVALSF